jgi:hypothetical protein
VTDETVTSRVVGADADLDLMFAQIKALRKLAMDPDAAQGSARVYDFSIRWGTLLHGRLERLAYYHSRGELEPDEQGRYEVLCCELREALPLVKRLGLASRPCRLTTPTPDNQPPTALPSGIEELRRAQPDAGVWSGAGRVGAGQGGHVGVLMFADEQKPQIQGVSDQEVLATTVAAGPAPALDLLEDPVLVLHGEHRDLRAEGVASAHQTSTSLS